MASSPPDIDIGAVLTAAYRRPDVGLDEVAAKVRARLALMETVGEVFRLLFEAPGSALTATLTRSESTMPDDGSAPSKKPNEGSDE